MKAKKSLGQNFLVDENIIKKIAKEILAFSNDLILEIGPGRGALTKYLIQKSTNYLAFEIDEDLKPILTTYENEKAHVVYEDFLKVDLHKYLKAITYDKLYIVGNLPYYITTPILEKIIASNLELESLIIMVQKEVGLRFMAQPNSKDYGYFTLYLKYFYDIEKVCDVSHQAFWPMPKVDSMVLKLSPRKNKIVLDLKEYQQFLKTCFKQKRKTLKNNLQAYDWNKIKTILTASNYSESVRAEELSEEILIKIFNYLKKEEI